MLTSTFLHAQGIGQVTERRLWEAGILTWEDLLGRDAGGLPLTASQSANLLPAVESAHAALAAGDFRYFARTLPTSEHWRAVPHFMERIAFLDIETNGGYQADDVTIIGVYDGFDSRIYVKDFDLHQFEADSDRYALWVTFFGTGFDVPFLKRRFPAMPFDQLHVDLCSIMHRLGFKGGLKKIEQTLGIGRADEVDGMSGMDAVHLWRRYTRYNDHAALEKLIAYNRADIENLQLLLAFAFGKMKTATGFPG